MSDKVYVTRAPQCDFGGDTHKNKAKYDFKTSWGPWANGCEIHWRTNRATPELGTGFGQRIIEGEEPERTDDDIRSDLAAAIEAGDFDAMEEALGDRDFAEFM
jgi:hypothetical protein